MADLRPPPVVVVCSAFCAVGKNEGQHTTHNSEQAAKGIINTPVLKCNSKSYKHSWLIFFFF